MNWGDIAQRVGQAAPLVGKLLAGPVGGTVGALVAAALDTEPTPERVQAALADPQAALALRRLELDHAADLRRLALQAETLLLQQIGETMRAEAASNDPWVRRWRPVWGYTTAAAWGVQTLALAGCVIGAIAASLAGQDQAVTALLDGTARLVGALTVQWSVALAVLGVQVQARSRDKQVAAGQQPTGLLGALLARTGGRGG